MFDNTQHGTVRFENVVKKYGQVTALKGLNLEIEQGKLVTLLGPSGCGKTTTLRLIAGLEAASSGTIFIGGQDVTYLTATYRKVSMVFQSYALFPHMTVAENVAYGLRVNSMNKKEAAEKAAEGLALVGLSGFGERLPSELSGGQQQRVAVARAIVLEPEVLLLDEPLSNLDAKLRRHVREEIRQIQQRLGLTAVYVTHDQEEAMAVSDEIIVMKDAEIAQQGTPADLYEAPNSKFIADFIGDANVVDCEVVGGADGSASVMLAGTQLNVPSLLPKTSAASLVMRPQNIRLTAPGTAKGIKGTVTYAAYLGNQIQYTVATDVGDIFIVDNEMNAAFQVGNDTNLVPDESKLVLLSD
ncbi:ABC transporter ATP-binding protein [Pseudophaeobacter sp.]|uniref:ABC transporter ATP-binding protein n=1 Tax=Pseudophaeobacter sp. TaxID=1971739 RepID=UPI003299BEFA